MAESEVESILREIRERVVSQQRTDQDRSADRSAMTNGGNGARDSEAFQQVANVDNEIPTAKNLSLIESQLTTTARAWDRLPPLLSNRSGSIAQLELWIKRQLKRATHWFTWEQVNFNAAVHQSLRELPPVMAAYEQELQSLRAQLAATQRQLTEMEVLQGKTETRIAALVNETETRIAALVNETETRVAALANETETRVAALVNELRGRDVQLQDELRERDSHLRDEQRVCLKQLALETSEAAVLEDRARRKSEALLEELQRRVNQLESGQK